MALNREVERVHHVGPEVRIERLAGASRNRVDAGIIRLHKSLTGKRDRGGETICTYAEGIGCGGGTGRAARAVAEIIEALHWLDKASAEQRYQYQVNAIQASIYSAVAAANHSVFMTENSASKGIAVKVRTPSGSNAWAE